MPFKREHLSLSDEQFNNIKAQLNELGKMFLNSLRSDGFTKIKSRPHWLSFRVEKEEEDLFVFIAFSLISESPQEFELVLRKLEIKDPPGPFVELYEKKIKNIDEFKSCFDTELALIKKNSVNKADQKAGVTVSASFFHSSLQQKHLPAGRQGK